MLLLLLSLTVIVLTSDAYVIIWNPALVITAVTALIDSTTSFFDEISSSTTDSTLVVSGVAVTTLFAPGAGNTTSVLAHQPSLPPVAFPPPVLNIKYIPCALNFFIIGARSLPPTTHKAPPLARLSMILPFAACNS